MNKEEMLAAAKALMKGPYSPSILGGMIGEGLFALPVGEPMIHRGDQYLVYTGTHVVSYKITDGVPAENNRTEATSRIIDGLIIQHAADAARI